MASDTDALQRFPRRWLLLLVDDYVGRLNAHPQRQIAEEKHT